MSFWGELKRRNVFKVGAAYVIAAWLILQVASITFPALNLPAWALTLVTVFLIIGFLIALILAWAYEVTPDGVKLTKKVPLADSITHVTGRKLNYILGGLLVVAVGYNIVLQFLMSKSPVQIESVSTVAEQAPVAVDAEETSNTIAVLPFENLSSDPEQEYFVDGLSEELLNCLAKINGLRVTSRTSSFAFKNTDKTLQEIAGVLGVDHILEGSVRKAGDALRITAQLIRVKDDSHLWSETYDRELKDIFKLQEEIASAVANELKLKLGIGESFKQLGGTDNVEAYELYLAAKGQLYTPGESWFHAYESINKATELDPDFALAWALKGFYQVGIGSLMRENIGTDYTAEVKGALNAAQKALELEPNLPEAYVVLGDINMVTGNWIEAESAFQKAIARKKDHLWGLELGIGTFYNSVGYFNKAKTLFEEILHNDPLSTPVRGFYILNLLSLGDFEGAEEANRRSKELIGDQWEKDYTDIAFILAMNGDAVTRGELIHSSPVTDTVKDLLGSPEKALSALHQCYNSTEKKDFTFSGEAAVWAAYFKDADFALDVMEETTVTNNYAVVTYFWLPVMKEVRQTPRFKKLVREAGLVDYWNESGWPDICQPLDNGDFECD